MAELAIILPALGDIAGLEETLVSVLTYRPPSAEVVVVLNGAYDDPYGLAGEVQFVEAPGGAGFAESVSAGLAVTQAAVVHLLCCGAEVTDGWCQTPLSTLRTSEAGCVAPVVVDRDDPQRVLSAGIAGDVLGRRRELCSGKTLLEVCQSPARPWGGSRLAGFYRRDVLEHLVTAWDTTVGDAWADVELALGLRRLGARCQFDPRSQVLMAAEVARAAGEDRLTSMVAGWRAERMFWRQAAAGELWGMSACHAGALLVEGLRVLVRPTAVMRLAGRLAGLIAAPLTVAQARRTIRRIERQVQAQAADAAVSSRMGGRRARSA